MKKLLLAVGVVLALASCASIPAPRDEATALIVGRLILDFPEGFFRQPPRTIRDAATVHLYNATQDKAFSTYTSSGYYHFLSNGTDEYVLLSYEYKQQSGGGSVTLGGERIMKKFRAHPGKVVYLADLAFTYTAPKVVKSVGGGASQTWDYTVLRDEISDQEGLREYLRRKDKSGAWLEREIVEPAAGQ